MNTKLKLVIIGGASSYTPELFKHIIENYQDLKITDVVLIDLKDNSDRLDVIYDLGLRMFTKHQIKINMTKTFDQKAGLMDADFIIVQIRVGRMDSRFYDETIPAQFDMLGHESIGIGGLFNALRTVPVMYEIIENVKEFAPKAWVINVTNPTGIISEAILRFAEFDRYMGLSSIPNQSTKNIIEALGAKKTEVVSYFAGLSELSFISKIYHKSKDKLPELLASGFCPTKCLMHLDYLKQFGLYPHPNLKCYYQQDIALNEFLENQRNHKIRTNEVIEIDKKLFEIYSDLNTYDVPKLIEQRLGYDYAETAIQIIDSMVNNKKHYHVINTVNRGHIIGIPDETSIEITSRITKKGPMPVYFGELPLQVRGIVQHLKSYEELLCDAIYEKNLKKALLAFQVHPLSKSFKQSKEVFDALYDKHKDYLKYYGAYNK
jgi:6-phospho-beta-glucosidase